MAERIQYEGYLRREDTTGPVLKQARAGMTIKEIVWRTGHSRGLVRQILCGPRRDMFLAPESLLELHLPWLDAQWAAGAHNATALWRQLRLQGFCGSERVVGKWATRRRHADRLGLERLQRVPSACTLAAAAHHRPRQPQPTKDGHGAAIEAGVPALVEAREIITAFHSMIRKHVDDSLDPRIARARTGLVSSFAISIGNDRDAVLSAITSSWSTGHVGGQITR